MTGAILCNSCIYCPEQIAQQAAWEVNPSVSDHDFGDRGDLLSCDSIESPSPVMIPAPTIVSTKGPSDNPIPLHSMNLHHLRDRQLSVAPGFRPDMRDAVRPSPHYPGIPDYPRSTLRLSRTHCIHVATALIRYQQQHNPVYYHVYVEGDNVDDAGRDAPPSIDHTRRVGMPVPVNEAVLALNRHNQRSAQQLIQHDNDAPDLVLLQNSSLMSTKAMEQLSHDTAVFQLSSLSGYKQYRKRTTSSVQPFNCVCGECRTFEPSNEGRIETFSSSNSLNPLSVNLTHNINMSQHPTAYWSTTDITMTQSPERIIRAMVRKTLAINSPNLAQRLHHNNPGSIRFPPMNEERVRQWLRELYPYEFSAIRYLGMDTNNSLNLSEISALFRALLQNHIRVEWFQTSMFTPPVAESLALVLRNQRDRFMLDYYDGYNLENPHLQSTHHLIWRTVITHIDYQNQRYNNCQWQMLFHEENLVVSQLPYIPTHVDNVINHLLAGYHGLPFYVVPSSRIYETPDASTYDTLQPMYMHREHAMKSPLLLKPTILCH